MPAILRLSGRTGEHSGARRVGLEDLAGGARASPAVHGTGRGVRRRHRQRQRQRRREGVARGRTRAPRRAGRAGDALARAPQDARRPGGEKDSPLLFLCSSRLLAGEALEAVRLEDLRLLVLEEGAGGLVLAKAGASAGKPGSHGLLGLANALGGRIGLAGGGGHDEREEAGGGGAARETPAKMKRWSRR